MPKRIAIGLDIGSSAVRAAQVTWEGKTPQISVFGQVGLPAGAVVEGEVRDKAAVGAAIKRLWTEGGFDGREVVLGVSSQRAMVRAVEMPGLGEKELRSALRYEIGELLPIPVEQAVFDFEILGPGKPNGDGNATSQVLVVVAQKDIVWDSIAVATSAGLKVRAVDASSLALLRAVPSMGEEVDAVVSVGAHLAVVAVRQGRTPKFMRTASVANDIELAARVGASSRFVAPPNPARGEGRPGGLRVDPVVEEIRSSIEYYLSHAQGTTLKKVHLTGGGAGEPGLAERLGSVLGVPVVAGTVDLRVDQRRLGLSDDQAEEASRRWTTAVGLALWGTGPGHAPNLLPPEIAEKSRVRQALVAACAGLVVVASGLAWLSYSRTSETSGVNRQIATEQSQVSELQARITSLSGFVRLQQDVTALRGLATSALSGDVDWVSLYHGIMKAVPHDATVTSVAFSQGAATPPAPNASPTDAVVGQVSISATTTGGLPGVARFIDALNKVHGIEALWVPNAATSADNTGTVVRVKHTTVSPGQSVTTFSATVQVTAVALSKRAASLPGGN